MSVVTRILDKGFGAYSRYLGNGINYARKVSGVPVTTNLKTGTKVVKGAYGEGTKLIELGEGNKLRQETGIRTIITDGNMVYLPRLGGTEELPLKKGFNNFANLIKSLRSDKDLLGNYKANFSQKSYIGKDFAVNGECDTYKNGVFDYIKSFIWGKGTNFNSSWR